MPALIWDESGSKKFELGISKVALYKQYTPGKKNLFNPYDTYGRISGKYLTSSNEEKIPGSNPENWYISPYIEIEPNTEYSMGPFPTNTTFPAYCLYTSDKTFISGAKYESNKYITFTSPSTAAYIRLSVYESYRYTLQIEEGSEPTEYVPYGREDDYYPLGVVWNGVTSISENPDGADASEMHADNMKYAIIRSKENFGATIEAYTYPEDFSECDGSKIQNGLKIGQQPRRPFGLVYRTEIDGDGEPGYILHLIYNATASPSDKDYETINDSPDAITFSWELDTTPIPARWFSPTATIDINSLEVDSAKLQELEDILYGTSTSYPRLPLPDEVLFIFDGNPLDLSNFYASPRTKVEFIPSKSAYRFTGINADNASTGEQFIAILGTPIYDSYPHSGGGGGVIHAVLIECTVESKNDNPYHGFEYFARSIEAEKDTVPQRITGIQSIFSDQVESYNNKYLKIIPLSSVDNGTCLMRIKNISYNVR